MEAVDLLLITVGEISDPPVPKEVMKSMHRLIAFKGVELHGLVIGTVDSTPLSTVCTQTHHFLSHYDRILLQQRPQNVT